MSRRRLPAARKILQQQPFSLLMEAELEDFGPGRAEIRIPLRYELSQQDGWPTGE